jgi:agmatine deiminase
MTGHRNSTHAASLSSRVSINSGGYRLPAEWEPHQATLLAWPVNRADWPGKFQPIPWAFAEIVRALTPSEPVHLFIPSRREKPKIVAILKRAGVDVARVVFIPTRVDRGWMRDCSPAFVVRGTGRKRSLAAVHFAFNAWAKYPNWRRDARIPGLLARRLGIPLLKAAHKRRHVVLEGGGIDTNGAGTLLTTEECLLDPDVQVRNPAFSRADYEAVFRKFMGIRNVVWLGKGIAGDDTHGHVDDLCRFVNTDTVILCHDSARRDANYRALAENRERLQGATDADGHKLTLVSLPMPSPLHFEGVRLPASYANFYIANDRVLVPTFNDPNDRIALGILAELFPNRAVIGIHAVDLVWGLGTLHCLTHEVPAQSL